MSEDPRLEPLHSVIEGGHVGLEGVHALFEARQTYKEAMAAAEGAATFGVVARGAALIFGAAVVMDGMGVGLPGVHTWPEDAAGHSAGMSSSVPASDPGDPSKVPADYGTHPGDPSLSIPHDDGANASYDPGMCQEPVSSDPSFHH